MESLTDPDSNGASTGVSSLGKQTRKTRVFDFTRYNQRHIALKIAYLGWQYRGFASQESVKDTVEEHLFSALTKLCLIKDRASSCYSRCGRTDKGVGALGQVIALSVRSNLLEGPGLFCPDGSTAQDRSGDTTTELDYVRLMNNVLPDDIRVLAWCPVSPHFNARFDCLCRTYKYFFPRGSLDIDLMRLASQKFVGEHDFRNFCKVVVLLTSEEGFSRFSPYQMCVMTVSGQAFLWHQVRCMASVLLLIGQTLEHPEVIDHMLDVAVCPGKPQYTMAAEYPLLLSDCEFEEVKWIYSQTADAHRHLVQYFQSLWSSHVVKAAVLDTMLQSITSQLVPENTRDASERTFPWRRLARDVSFPTETLIPGFRSKQYRPLLERPTADTLEERLAKKKRTDNSEESSTEQNREEVET
ncbi:tRNA pseudouridine(38/39) synthase-like isoform X2 [Corticium candelabrum]|uniref:tRNA pseudouridine(38/39) synthase-like isoform X2 n=1 Tax=Corticium candelabrum TaxID=121492 RepID=UPI002E26C7B7|nr:tRNA pseudouridine(38/39) synthase-like isoform X2 [Corticium candelabrum]